MAEDTDPNFGKIANEDMVLSYSDTNGQNTQTISFKSFILWIWKKLTNLDKREKGDFVLTNNDCFVSLTNKSKARENLGAKNRYLTIKRDFTSGGMAPGPSSGVPIPVPVNYELLVIKSSGWFRLPKKSDDRTLVDGQQLKICREVQPGIPTIRSNEIYNSATSYSLYYPYSIISFIYDAKEDKWRIDSVIGTIKPLGISLKP